MVNRQSKRKKRENAWYLINVIEKPSKSTEFRWNLSVNAHICPVKHVILIGPQPLNSSERLHLKATNTHTHTLTLNERNRSITRSNITMLGHRIKWDKPSGICRVAGKSKVLLSYEVKHLLLFIQVCFSLSLYWYRIVKHFLNFDVEL